MSMTSDTWDGLVARAYQRRTGIGAFNVVLLEHAEAIVAGAEQAGLPVILQISENCVKYHGGLAPILTATLEVAAASSVPAQVHLDHIEDPDLVRRGVELGVTSVMFDASKLGYDENVAATRSMSEFCHANGVSIEAELGEVGGKDGVHAPGVRTDPTDAAAFVSATRVDALAVAVGTSHAMTDRSASVDLALIRALSTGLDVPLVLHGSSGLPDAEIRGAVVAGMTKINISTHLNGLFTRAVRDEILAHPDKTDPRAYIRAGRDAMAPETAHLLKLIAGA